MLTVVCFAASPLAFALLALLLAAIGLARLPARAELALPAATVGAVAIAWLVLWRLFPTAGRFPFSIEELAAVCVFCVLGIVFTWRVHEARVLRWLYVLYLPVCVIAFLVPSGLGENVARLRFAAVPLAVLTLSLRRWRPLPLAAVAFLLALSWNVSPLAASYAKGASDPASDDAYWAPAIGFLEQHLDPSYRVEAVDTTGHWAAAYLPGAGIPITRGWFRQDDFPRNEVLYDATSWARACTPAGFGGWRFATSCSRTPRSTTALRRRRSYCEAGVPVSGRSSGRPTRPSTRCPRRESS